MRIEPSTLEFLADLKENNDRDWFAANKPRYQEAQKSIKALGEEVKQGLNAFDVIDDVKVFRIYRDVRFSKDKSPYKKNLGINLKRATAARRGGYYLHIEPGNVFVAGGFWQPESKDLKRIRQEFDVDIDSIEEIVGDKTFKKHFGEMEGEKLKSSPRDYPSDHPHIEWLRMKSFVMVRRYKDADAVKKNFSDKIIEDYKAMLPFHEYMSSVLTTDMNGESII